MDTKNPREAEDRTRCGSDGHEHDRRQQHQDHHHHHQQHLNDRNNQSDHGLAERSWQRRRRQQREHEHHRSEGGEDDHLDNDRRAKKRRDLAQECNRDDEEDENLTMGSSAARRNSSFGDDSDDEGEGSSQHRAHNTARREEENIDEDNYDNHHYHHHHHHEDQDSDEENKDFDEESHHHHHHHHHDDDEDDDYDDHEHEHHGHSHGDHHHHDSSAMEVQIRPGVTKHVMCVRHDLGDDCTCPSCTHTETDNKKFWDKLYSLNAEQDTDSEYLLAYESLASALAKQMIVETGRGTPSEARVLLPGCGDSRFSVSMYQATVFKHITNTDISEVAIKMQDKYFDHLKAATVTNLVDDAAKTRLPPQSFDLVIDKSLLDCLSYCSDDETTVESRISRLMAGFYEVLAPGGRCILVVSEQNEPANVLPYVSEAWAPVNAMLMDAICCGSALAPKPWEVLAVVSLDYAQDGHGISRGAPVVASQDHLAAGHDLWNCDQEGLPSSPPRTRFWLYTLRKGSREGCSPAPRLPPPLLPHGTQEVAASFSSRENGSAVAWGSTSGDYHAISGALLEWSAQVLPTLTTIETSCQQWVTELRIFRQNPYRIRQAEQLKAELRHTDNVDPDATSSIGHLAASQAQTFKIKLSSVQVRYVSARRHVETILRTQASALETRWVSQKLMHVKLALDSADVALNEVTKLLPSASFGGWVG